MQVKSGKFTKRLVSVILMVVMIFSVCIPATAETQKTIAPAVSVTELMVGETAALKVCGWNIKTFWTSADENVATVDCKGVVTAVAEGETTITAKSRSFFGMIKKMEFYIIVKPFEADVTIEIGEDVELVVDACGITTWTTDDESIAMVDNGIVTGISEGVATITATTMKKVGFFWFLGLGKTVKTVETFTVEVKANGTTGDEEIPEGTYCVTFDSNGGSEIEPQYVNAGKTATFPGVPEKEGFAFVGWYVDEECTVRFDFSTTIQSNTTVYAAWRDGDYAEIFNKQKEELDELKKLNDGKLPEIILNKDTYMPMFILGTYSDVIVTDFDSAIESLKDVENIMEFQNVEEEYVGISTFTFEDTTQYRLQQMYDGYVVYGQQLVITTDETGKVTSLSGDYVMIDALLDPAVNITAEKAIDIAAEYCEFENSDVSLVVYTLDGYNEMAYVLANIAYTVVVSANDGTVILDYAQIITDLPSGNGTMTSAEGRNEDGDTFNTIYYDYSDPTKQDTYVFYDKVRDILYHDFNNIVSNDFYRYYNTDALTNYDNVWNSNAQKAIVLSKNLSNTYDFYLDILGLMSYDGEGGRIFAYVNDGFSYGTNAFNCGPCTIDGEAVTLLSFGGVANYQNDIDVVGHEFTHAVQGALVKELQYSGQTGSLMEAYSDVMGELVEAYYTTDKRADWLHGERNMIDPSSNASSYIKDWKGTAYLYPSQVYGVGYYTGSEDNGGVHHNSTIISHAVYKMYENGINNIAELTELLYRAWGYLTPTATFHDYRISMVAAAKSMNFSNEEIDFINDAFDDAGINLNSIPEDYDQGFFTSVNVNYHIEDYNTLEPIPGAQIVINKLDEDRTEVAHGYCDAEGRCSFNLKAGYYIITESAPGYFDTVSIVCFNVLETVDITSKLIKKSEHNDTIVFEVGGKVTNALTGQPLSEVTMNFRKGYEITSGRVALSITTDANGKYYTDTLENGYYTIELIKPGYITSYVIAQVASTWGDPNSENILNQNFSISPMVVQNGTLRIVLSWGENPRDLDSHLYGESISGNSYHVYYADQIAYDNGETIVELDIDDTSSYGPETTTVNLEKQGDIIHYYVHDYSTYSSESSMALASSGAVIQVYSDNNLIATYNVPSTQPGTVWHVFDYDVSTGRITPKHEVTGGIPR